MDCFVGAGGFIHWILWHLILWWCCADGTWWPGSSGNCWRKIKVKPLKVYHGKAGKGLSVDDVGKAWWYYTLSVVQNLTGRSCFLLLKENQYPAYTGNRKYHSRYRFSIGVKNFVNTWTAMGLRIIALPGSGIASKIKKFGELLNIEVVQVCWSDRRQATGYWKRGRHEN